MNAADEVRLDLIKARLHDAMMKPRDESPCRDPNQLQSSFDCI